MRYLKPAALLLLLVGSSVPFLSRAAIASEETLVASNSNSSDNELSQSRAATESAIATSQARLVALLDGAQGETNRSLIQSVSFRPVQQSPLLAGLSSGSTGNVILDSEATQEPWFSQYAKSETIASETLVSEASDEPEEGIPIEVTAQLPADETPENSTSEDRRLRDMEDFRRLVQEGSQVQAPIIDSDESLPDSDDSLPTLEAPAPTAPVASPAESDLPTEPIDDGLVEIEENTDLGEPALGDVDTDEPIVEPISSDADLDAVPDVLTSDPNPLSVPTVSEEIDIERNPVVTLEQAIQLAYRNNQALQTSILQLEQAEAALDEAKAARLPSAVVQGNLRNQQSGSVDVTELDTTFQINYDLLTGGSRSAAIRTAELQQEIRALAVEAQQEQLRLVTANLYYALQESIEQIRINQSFVNEAERNLRDSELRQEVGVGTRFDVLRAEVQLANAQQALVQSQFNEDITRRDIARLLNLPPTAGLETTPVEKAEDWPLDLEDSILLAFQNRAELEQQLNQAEISEQQREIALAAIRPQVNLFANYGLNVNIDSPGNEFGDLSDSTSFGLQLNWTLFNGGASRALARQQEIGALIAEEQFSETLDQVRFDVEEAFFNIQANDANITTSNSAVAQAEAALELANLRLQAGVGTQLDVLSAQTELTQAQVNNVTAILGYNRALVAIQRAISNLGL